MRITSKGQVTIPKGIRERTGLLPHTEVDFIVDGRGVRIVKTRTVRRPMRGEAALNALRRRSGGVSMTTDEITALTRGPLPEDPIGAGRGSLRGDHAGEL